MNRFFSIYIYNILHINSFSCSLLVSCSSSRGKSHQANGSTTQENPTNAGERMPAQPATPEPEPGAE